MLFDTNRQKKIILVDDDPVNHQICKMVFARTIDNVEFKIFDEGFTAFQWIAENESEINDGDEFILMLDLNMPVLDGWEFLNYFEKLKAETREKFNLYILTSSINDEDKERATHFTSVRHFYNKPLTRRIITEILEETHD